MRNARVERRFYLSNVECLLTRCKNKLDRELCHSKTQHTTHWNFLVYTMSCGENARKRFGGYSVPTGRVALHIPALRMGIECKKQRGRKSGVKQGCEDACSQLIHDKMHLPTCQRIIFAYFQLCKFSMILWQVGVLCSPAVTRYSR